MTTKLGVLVLFCVVMVFSAWGEEDWVKETRERAEGGDADAQFNLGLLYDAGRVVPRDYVEAMRWYRRSADQGNASAQANLGLMYSNGLGVPKDDGEAMKWFLLSAEQGYASAQFALGMMYHYGRGGGNISTAVPRPIVPRPITNDEFRANAKLGAQSHTRAEMDLTDAYMALILQRIREFMRRAGINETREANVEFNISSTGVISGARIVDTAGNSSFDVALLESFRNIRPIGPPPTGRAGLFIITFTMDPAGAQKPNWSEIKPTAENDEMAPQKNIVYAYKWYNLASAQGHKEAIRNRSLIEREMTSSQIEEAQRISREWLVKNKRLGRDLPPTEPRPVRGTGNIGVIAHNALRTTFGGYLTNIIDTVDVQWNRDIRHSLETGVNGLTPGSRAKVTFILGKHGQVRVRDTDGNAGGLWTQVAVESITASSPYNVWTDKMESVLGEEQEITFIFYY